MYYSTEHTIYLQDGTLFNFKRRFKRNCFRLIQAFSRVKDGRGKFGKRHPLPLVLIILFSGITAGYTTIKDCHLWALHNRKWLEGHYDLPHGIPSERTLSRAIQRADIDSLTQGYLDWETILYGFGEVFSSDIASFDGKTMRGVHGKEYVKHILSLFSHKTHQILGQIGVDQKTNEIPAFRTLLDKTQKQIYGMLLVGDALHTQKETIKKILERGADYLLFVKLNQGDVESELATFFNKLPFQAVTEKASYHDNERDRDVTTILEASCDAEMNQFLDSTYDFQGIKTIAKIKREGQRKGEKGEIIPVNETVYAICSRPLTAEKVAQIARDHWCIASEKQNVSFA